MSNGASAEMSQPADWEALARYVAGESPPEEVAQIESQLAANPDDKALLDALSTLTARIGLTIPAELDVEAALQRVKARRNEPVVHSLDLKRAAVDSRRHVRWRVSLPAIAAAALLAIGIAGYLALHNTSENAPVATLPSAQMVATGVGALDSLRLPDGTRVILGPLSSIRLVASYGAARRDVEVKGDAYLEVIHDAARPFTVRADGATIHDLGTRFTVRTDAPEGVAVAVAEGSVSLQGASRGRAGSIVLKPGERGVVLPDGRTSAQRATPDDMAWLRRQLVFREAPMREVAASLYRWYGIKLSVPDASLASRHLTATFSGETPEQILDVIQLVLGADIERRGDTAIVRARK
jgi:transmembrane sensor